MAREAARAAAQRTARAHAQPDTTRPAAQPKEAAARPGRGASAVLPAPGRPPGRGFTVAELGFAGDWPW